MTQTFGKLALARAALGIGILITASWEPPVFAAGAVTTYSNGDLFVGFRQEGIANTLAVKIGATSQFMPNTIPGGTAVPGSTFNVSFGMIPAGEPNAGNTALSLAADLLAVFGSSWAANNNVDSGLDVSWAVAGITNYVSDNSPINGLNRRTSFETFARTSAGTVADAPANFSVTTFASNFNAFANGSMDGAYNGRISTVNSSNAHVGAAANGNNWGTRIGTPGSTFGSGYLGEQPLSGANSGPTNSLLDFYVMPATGSTLLASPTYLGTFSLSPSGALQYQVVPEPGGAALVGVGAAMLGVLRRRHWGKTPTRRLNPLTKESA